ncbi:MAG: hypothetical protein K0R67_2561, partial [Paenibacillus sp.]|nr:hypothetical protein [Paenibacillus sp.]
MDNLTPFIENHHLNIVFKQIQKLSYAIDHISDQKVIEALRYSVELAVLSGLRVNTEADKAV